MSFTCDWKLRVEHYIQSLERRIVKEVIHLVLKMATTYDILSLEEAKKLDFNPVKPGVPWGREWEYAWFKTQVTIPDYCENQRLEIFLKCNETGKSMSNESLVWINNIISGSSNKKHDYVLLTPRAKEGESFELMIESYAGHGNYGPNTRHYCVHLPGADPVPKVASTQQVVPKATVVTWNEEAYQLYMDLMMLYLASQAMDEKSMRRNKIEKALEDVTCILDLEAEDEAFNKSVLKGMEFIAPLMNAHNGSTSPEMFCIGHSHLDVAWEWTIDVAKRKALRTFSTALRMMDEYPEYKFLQSQPYLYCLAAEYAPEMYEEIKKAVKRSQWVPDGAMWVESDTNLVSGESLIRQFLYGKRFFKGEFGIDSKVLWLPDVFGYSGALPQIMQGCGVKYFSTHKIYKNFQGGTDFPYDTYIWEGIDGSTVVAHNHYIYSAETKPDWLLARWNRCNQKKETEIMLYPYGWGDGGGGPVRDHLEYLRRADDFEGIPRTRQASLQEFFEELEKKGIPENARYVGEIYYEAHRGVYTTHGDIKKANRKSELGLREAEMWCAATSVIRNKSYPKEKLEQLWKGVLLNQFHDILPGSSMDKVYKIANEEYREILKDVSALIGKAQNEFVKPSGDGYTIFNSLSWERDAYVVLHVDSEKVKVVDADGNIQPFQGVKHKKGHALLVRFTTLPPCGAKTFQVLPDETDTVNMTGTMTLAMPGLDDGTAAEVTAFAISESGGGLTEDTTMKATTVSLNDNVMENEFLRVEFNSYGEITSLFDKEEQRELVKDSLSINRLEMYEDQPTIFDGWELERAYKKNPVDIYSDIEIHSLSAGPLEARIRVKRRINKSVFSQDIVLRAGERRVDFETEVEWWEDHKLLKVAFPVDIFTSSARYEIQFGHVCRDTHENTDFEKARFEVCGHRWMDISEHNYGFTILNDCKYGWDTLDGIPRLTLLRSPMVPDKSADRGHHSFTYSVFPHRKAFDHKVVRQGYELNVPVYATKGVIGNKDEFSLFSISAPNVVIETVKCSEKGSGLVVRMYEALRQRTCCKLWTGFNLKKAASCNMLEEEQEVLEISDGAIDLTFKPFEVKTVMLEVEK